MVSNHFHVKVDDFSLIYIFSVHYNPKIPLDNTVLRRRLLEENREKLKGFIEGPVISGNNIYSTKAPLTESFEIEAGEQRINIKQVKVLDVKQNPNLLLSFLPMFGLSLDLAILVLLFPSNAMRRGWVPVHSQLYNWWTPKSNV